MNKAVFLDRDGVINRDNINYTYRIADFHFNEGIFEALRLLIQKGYQLVIITNQSGIDKQIYSHDDVKEVHHYLLERFKKESISILEIYVIQYLCEVFRKQRESRRYNICSI